MQHPPTSSNTDFTKEQAERKYVLDDFLKNWASFHDTMKQLLQYLTFRNKHHGHENTIYYNNEFDSNQTDFEMLSAARIIGASSPDEYEGSILLAFLRLMVDQNPFCLSGIFEDYPLDTSCTLPQLADLIVEYQEGHISDRDTNGASHHILQQLLGPSANRHLDIHQITQLFRDTDLSSEYDRPVPKVTFVRPTSPDKKCKHCI